MRFIFSTFLCFALISYGEIKLEEIPRLNTTTALKILSACHQESVDQKVEVAIVIVGIDGRVLASSKSEKDWIRAFMILPSSKPKPPASKERQPKICPPGTAGTWKSWILAV